MEATIVDILHIASETDPNLHVGAGVGPFGPFLSFVSWDCHGFPVAFVVSLDQDERPLAWWRAVIGMKWRCVSCLVGGKTGRKRDYPDLVAPTREALQAAGKIHVIENVAGAPLENPIMLCGEMFGLQVFRHRYFETNVFLLAPPHPKHPRGSTTNAYRGRSSFASGATHIGAYGAAYILADAKIAMNINWMTRRELSQAIPPAYTRGLGEQPIAHYFPEYDHADQSQRLSRQLG